MGDLHFISSLVIVGAVLSLFCFGLPGYDLAGPNTFVPGLIAILLGGVALSVVALRADRKNRGEG